MAKSYAEKLRDPRWQRKRLEILQRSNFSCEACSATDRTLNVHHRIYRRGADPWAYADHELASLCEDCHQQEHSIRTRVEEVFAQLPPNEIEVVLGYAQARLAICWGLELDKQKIPVTSWDQAYGMLEGLWNWNLDVKPDPDCLIDHGSLNDMLVCRLGEGEMPLPGKKS